MLSELFNYSALHSKTSAMTARHLTEQQYAELADKQSVADACSYLKNNTVYAPLFEGINERELHRSDIERLLDGYMQSEVQKLYNFADMSTRRLVSYTYFRYEINLLKQVLRGILSTDPIKLEYNNNNFFYTKLAVDLKKLSESKTIREFLAAVEGTPYYKVLSPPLSQPKTDLFTVEMHLDGYYFRRMWQLKDKALKGQDKKVITQSFGGEIDMLNLMWIYRFKKYYQLDNELIFPSIIPIHYKISQAKLTEMVYAPDLPAFLQLAAASPYAALFENLDSRFIEQNYTKLVYDRISKMMREYPFSIISILGYVHFLETEIKRIVTVIESIRYGVAPK